MFFIVFLLNLLVAHLALRIVSVPTGICTALRFAFPKVAHYAASGVSRSRKSLAIMPGCSIELVPVRRGTRGAKADRRPDAPAQTPSVASQRHDSAVIP
jgi:hypothetical protein